MSDGSTIKFRSPYITASQKASLKLLEDGLSEGSDVKSQEGLRSFFEISYQLTEREVCRTWGETNLATLEALAQDESSYSAPLREVLWSGETLTSFGQRFLRWSEEPGRDDETVFTLEELNEYLQLSVEFYASLPDERGQQDRPIPGVVSVSHNSLDLILDPETMSDLDPSSPQAAKPNFQSLVDPPVAQQAVLPEMLADLLAEAPSVPSADADLEARLEALLEEPWESTELRTQIVEESSAPLDTPLPEPEDEPAPEVEPEAAPEPDSKPVVNQKAKEAAPASPPVPNSDFSDIEEIALPQSPLSPLEQRSQLAIKKKYLGYGKNEDGVLGYCGQLTVSRFDDRPLKGQLESSNPLLFFSPQILRGALVTVTYWMPPAAFPQPGGHLTVGNEAQKKVLPISSLFPRSRTDFLKFHQVLTLLLAPSVLGLLYFCFVFVLSVNGVIGQVKDLFPETYTAALRGSAALDFRSQGVGLYQLEIVPAAESLSLIWAALIWLCPLVATKFFRHLSRVRQKDLGGALAFSLLLPSFGIVALWNVQKILFPLLDHPDFGPLDLRVFLPWSVPLNLLVAVYLFLSVHGVWDRRIAAKEVRFLLPLILSGGYLVVAFLLIFGRSWTG